LGQRMDELGHFVFRVNRRRGEKFQLEGFSAGLSVLLQTLSVWFGALLGKTDEISGELKERRVESPTALEEIVRPCDLGSRFLGRGDAVPGAQAIVAGPRLGRDAAAELGFGPHFSLEEGSVAEPRQAAGARLSAILDRLKILSRMARLLRAHSPV